MVIIMKKVCLGWLKEREEGRREKGMDVVKGGML
jgi:hypothetical protein